MNKDTSKSTINRTNIKKQITKILIDSKKPLSTSEIAKKLDKNWHKIIRYCLDLELESKISKFSLGRMNVWQMKK